MRDGFVKVSAASPHLKIADCTYNREQIEQSILEMEKNNACVMVFPELCLTGYECRDLFLQDKLIESSLEELGRLTYNTKNIEAIIFVGLPLIVNNKLYNVSAVLNKGKILGVVPKINIPNYSEFYESRYFNPGELTVRNIELFGKSVPFGAGLIFEDENMKDLKIGVEICEDLWVPMPPSVSQACAGVTLTVNLSASDEIIGKDEYRRLLLKAQSGRCINAYVYATAGYGESTTDMVFGAHNIIVENGSILTEANLFDNETIYADIDVKRLVAERQRITTFKISRTDEFQLVKFNIKNRDVNLKRQFSKTPFVPNSKKNRDIRCGEILNIQSLGLKKRLEHTKIRHAIIGISGGLDSTLALLVTVRTFDMLGVDRKNIIAVTMPCFGTTDKTYNNALKLTNALNVTLKEVRIEKEVRQHFKDIGHDESNHDVTYENVQARIRTLVLMDIANEYNGLVIGTGDLSELALGWATYNGDHMSMYAVNCSVPKTLVRYLVSFYAEKCENENIKGVLEDILSTPVSPELLPPEEGKISQKTEELVGPYELHDFFLYYMLRFGYAPRKIYRLACNTFGDEFEEETIKKWIKVFYRRFFLMQFKRNCLPDGPKVGTITVSPRGDLRMTSDSCSRIWMEECEKL